MARPGEPPPPARASLVSQRQLIPRFPPPLLLQDRQWDLDVGSLQARLYYSGAEPSPASHAALRRRLGLPPVDLAALPPYPGWTRPIVSLEVGPEQMAGAPLLAETLVRWETLGWDVQVA